MLLLIEERFVWDIIVLVFIKMLEDFVVDVGEEVCFDVRIFVVLEFYVEWYWGLKKILDEGWFVYVDVIEEDLFILIIE